MNTSTETPAEVLARSAFGFGILALLTSVIALVWLLFGPPSGTAALETARVAINIGSAVLVVVLLALCVFFFRADPKQLMPASRRIANLLSQGWVVGLLILVLVEVNLLAFLLLDNIAAGITNPAKFLLLSWSLLLVFIIATVNAENLRGWFQSTRNVWAGLGLVIMVAAGLLLLFGLNRWALQSTGVADQLRGALDYRVLDFYDDGGPAPDSQAFWLEQSQTRIRWSPYTYWVVDAFDGDYVNVDASGIRHTPDYTNASAATRIALLGGSTVWGEGARDAYTIPGHLARLLDEAGMPQHVVNLGQTGYVSTQDALMFQFQLIGENPPDIAIFYQGFNDVLSAWGNDLVGVTLQEAQRLGDSEVGRLLRMGQPVLRPPFAELTTYDLTLSGAGPVTPEAVVERWFNNQRLIQSLADAYGVEVAFVWQPMLIYKAALSAAEREIMLRTERERPGLFDLYAQVDAIVMARTSESPAERLVILSDLFADVETSLFIDLVHINEEGNAIVAEALLPLLTDVLAAQS